MVEDDEDVAMPKPSSTAFWNFTLLPLVGSVLTVFPWGLRLLLLRSLALGHLVLPLGEPLMCICMRGDPLLVCSGCVGVVCVGGGGVLAPSLYFSFILMK